MQTNRGRVEARTVVSAVAGWSTLVCGLAGVRLPITTHILQAFVTEPVKPFLDPIVVSAQMHVYVSQTDRGEFLVGAEIEPYTTYAPNGTFGFLEARLASHARALPPARADQGATELDRALRPLARLQPDSRHTPLERFHVSAGWGTYGFKAAPIVGTTLAELVASGRTPELIAPFALERFHRDRLVSELAAAAVSH